MGWFWADSPAPSSRRALHPLPRSDATPPPPCPMHKPTATQTSLSSDSALPAGACPYKPPSSNENRKSALSALNPLNYMPSNLSQSRESAHQTIDLPLERETSTIPKGDGSGNWEYPSPQQMYNAMLRKGYTDTPQDAVESMVAVHNFLNEGAWNEIVGWERRFAGGIRQGWELCRRGEEGFAEAKMVKELERRRRLMSRGGQALAEEDREPEDPRLVRFMGRPGDMTPKARILQFLGWAYPAGFATEPPFDRHDWYVQRTLPDGSTKEVRYVIDYYSGPPEPTGEPVFYLDVRPAVDGPAQAVERLIRTGGDVWWRGSGGKVREMERQQQQQQKK